MPGMHVQHRMDMHNFPMENTQFGVRNFSQGMMGGGGGNCRVFVGNLSYDVAWQDLKDCMRRAGNVIRADVLTVTEDGRQKSKGCGVVEYSTPYEAQMAIQTMTNFELKGRLIFVREDREKYHHAIHGSNHFSASAPVDASVMRRRVYVGNLPYEVAWQDLKDHMRQAGDVVRADVMTNAEGRSQGCGIVEFATEGAAIKAISTLNDTDFKGRLLFVREDRPAGERNIGTGTGSFTTAGGLGTRRAPPLGSSISGSHTDRNTTHAVGIRVFVGNLAWDVAWQDLKDHMRSAGNVVRADVKLTADGRSAGCGLVEFESNEGAVNAISTLNNTMLKGRQIFVREDREEGKRG
eukprot:CAMPEP_0182416912 /NCGR_PEP_ID=MMETSP1167-20130531/1310_1 /TAXON_ID=2988 /ORGANISM="Mallomonas Sp, Strain CCMP3275" /LENGTH=349 /DNA_ID=CAMNT_0024590089 /DNA_START=218 /DNA_END=1267 /DNA_ORIENTATION=+